MLIGILTFIHVVVCLFLVIVVLLQSGKAADLAGAFGGMGSQTAFGPRGSATVLSKATTIAAGLFMVTSLSLSIVATRGVGSSATVLDKAKVPAKLPAKPPSVTLTPEGGGTPQTIPLNIPEQQQPSGQQQKSPAAGKQAPAPQKK